jgi:hypothetical protein
MTTRTLVGSAIALMVAIAITPVHAAGIQLKEVLSGLSKPVFVTNAGDGSGRLFVVEQGGVIKVLRPGLGTPLSTVFLDITAKVLSGASGACSDSPSTRSSGRTTASSSTTRARRTAPP